MHRPIRRLPLLFVLLAAPTWAAEPLRLTHGIASGDVTATTAVIWARASRAAEGQVVPDDRGRPGALTLIPAR